MAKTTKRRQAIDALVNAWTDKRSVHDPIIERVVGTKANTMPREAWNSMYIDMENSGRKQQIAEFLYAHTELSTKTADGLREATPHLVSLARVLIQDSVIGKAAREWKKK